MFLKIVPVIALCLACSSPEPVTATATDASTEASTDAAADATSDVVAFDAPVDAIVEAAVDAGACALAPVDGGACNSLASTGAAVTPACKNGSPPTAIGGSILDGRYVLTKMEIYNQGGNCPTQAEQIDWSICGNQWETVQSFGQPPVHTNATVTAQNNGLALSLTCPNAATSQWTYDATPSGMVLYIPMNGSTVRVDTFTRM